jgi:hypothetical protein
MSTKIAKKIPIAINITKNNSYYVYLVEDDDANLMPCIMVTDNVEELLTRMEIL